MALIEIKDVSKRFRKGEETITPLDGVSLNIEQGELVSLMGASGTGKSTLLNLVASIDKPDRGSIVIDGTDIIRLSRTKLAHWRAVNIGYIFQTHNLVPVLTAYENIELPLLLLPMSRSERRRRIDIALQAVDLTDRAEHYPRQLSGGQEQRVGVARAIVAHPKVVVADEPTSGLDPDRRASVLQALIGNLPDNAACILVTHDMSEARGWCHRVLVMLAGRVIEEVDLSTDQPQHPYAQLLFDPWAHAVPKNPLSQAGCPFRPDCPLANDRVMQKCSTVAPRLEDVESEGRHRVACHAIAEGTLDTQTQEAPC